MGFPCGSAGKESAYIARDLGSIHGLGRSPGKWKGYPLQYSGLENCNMKNGNTMRSNGDKKSKCFENSQTEQN